MAIPRLPPIALKATASSKNWRRMSLPFAPTAMRIPISRVRSVTLTSMIFMIPIPPTRRETPATAARKNLITADVAVAACAISC